MNSRILVVTAVDAERDAVIAGLSPTSSADRSPGITVVAGGVGSAAAAATTARLLAEARHTGEPYDLVVSAGIAGGVVGRAEVGTVVLASRAVAADLGADSADGFLSVAQLGFGLSTMEASGQALAALRAALPKAKVGEVLTVNTVTGTAQRAAEIVARHCDAVAEAMEGFGVATAAAQAGVGFVELRTISNPVGPRDRAAWRIGEALTALRLAAAALPALRDAADSEVASGP